MKQNRMMEDYLQNSYSSQGNLKDLLESEKYLEANGGLVFPVGKNNENIYIEDLSQIPSMLIAGTTGSGKTSFVQAIINSLILQYTPNELKIAIVDSKGIDYLQFKDIPHLLTPIIPSSPKVCGLLNWLLTEAKQRLSLLSKNRTLELEQIVVIIDDFSLVSQYPESFEYIQQLLAICRSVNIHCIFCTSIPTTEIISPAIKTNITHRVAFRVSSRQLSKLVIDDVGAETLDVPGEALIKTNNKQYKCNTVFSSDEETKFIVQQLEEKHGSFSTRNVEPSPKQEDELIPEQEDELIENAAAIILETGNVSTAILQRRLLIGYQRATRIIEQLKKRGAI